MAKRKMLTDRQHSFVLNYLRNGFKATQAAIDAGYTQYTAITTGSKMLDKPLIKERINAAYRQAERKQFNELVLTVGDKAKLLLQIIYDVIPQDGSEPRRDYYKDALKAMQELNKMAGDYAPDRRLNVTVDATKDRLIEAKRQYEDY